MTVMNPSSLSNSPNPSNTMNSSKNIPVYEPSLGEKERKYVMEAMQSGWISSKGKFIEQFESGFSSYCGRQNGISTSNGTTALHLALKALGIGKGDEVIVPDLSFIAVANAVTYCNAKPVFVDSHPDYWCMDPREIEEKVSRNTKAIISVHLYGHPCDMDPILDIADDSGLFVIEDAAEAHGAEYKGKKVGGFGDVSCFSFYGNKIMTTGEGGMCLTQDNELAKKMRVLRDHGMNPDRQYWHDKIGFNYRMTNLQAAIGCAQLEKLDQIVEKKRLNAGLYRDLFKAKIQDRIDAGSITLHPEMSWAKNVYWMYSILIGKETGGELGKEVGTKNTVGSEIGKSGRENKNNSASTDRDRLIQILQNENIETRPLFFPIRTMPPYSSSVHGTTNEITGSISGEGLNLPSSMNLAREDIERIADRCISAFVHSSKE